MNPADELLTSQEVATLRRIKVQTLRRERSRGKGPPYLKFGQGRGGRVLYRAADLRAWLASRLVTTDEAA
jgi:hypothetical protein